MHGGYGSGIGHRTGNHREGAIDGTGMGISLDPLDIEVSYVLATIINILNTNKLTHSSTLVGSTSGTDR